MAKTCPKCGMHLENLNTTDIDKEVVSGNNAVIKSFMSKKILVIIAACIAALIVVFLIWLYGGSQYALDDSVFLYTGISNSEGKMISKAYSEIERECKLAKIFHKPLNYDCSSSINSAFDYFTIRFNDNSLKEDDEIIVLLALSKPIDYYTQYTLGVSYDSTIDLVDRTASIKTNKELSKKYIEKIEKALTKIKDEYCK